MVNLFHLLFLFIQSVQQYIFSNWINARMINIYTNHEDKTYVDENPENIIPWFTRILQQKEKKIYFNRFGVNCRIFFIPFFFFSLQHVNVWIQQIYVIYYWNLYSQFNSLMDWYNLLHFLQFRTTCWVEKKIKENKKRVQLDGRWKQMKKKLHHLFLLSVLIIFILKQ